MRINKKVLAITSVFGGGILGSIAIVPSITNHSIAQPTTAIKAVSKNNIKSSNDEKAFYAHRGYDAKFPEETSSAFQGAINEGFNGVEFDVWMTKDGIPVINHDATINRTVRGGYTGNVNSYTFAQLEKFDFSKGFDNVPPQKMLSLAEFTKEFSGQFKYINMEIKAHEDNIEQSSWNVVEPYVAKHDNQWMMQSFEQDVIKTFYNLNTGIRIGLLANNFLGLEGSGIYNYITDFNPLLLDVQLSPFYFTRILKEYNLRTSVWTVNTKLAWNILEYLQKRFNFSANYISDYPIFKGIFK